MSDPWNRFEADQSSKEPRFGGVQCIWMLNTKDISLSQSLDSAALNQLFQEAHTHNKWQPREVPDELLRSIVEHLRWAPTSANCSPARFIFVKSNSCAMSAMAIRPAFIHGPHDLISTKWRKSCKLSPE